MRDFIVQISKEINAAGINAAQKIQALNEERPKFDQKYFACPQKGPHFHCDHKDCCFHLRSPMFTFEKRLVGYIRYAAFEWWVPGLKW